MKSEFSEDTYYAEYKKIRNRIRKYTQNQIRDFSLNYLVNDKDVEGGNRPWIAFLLLKWLYVENHNFSGKKLDQQKFDYLLWQIQDLAQYGRMPSDYDHYYLFFRSLSYQQFIFQLEVNHFDMSRQLILFSEIDRGLDAVFKREVGISTRQFIEIAFLVLCHQFTEKSRWIHPRWFSPIFYRYPKIEIETVLDLLSVPVESLRDYLVRDSSTRRSSKEYYEQTPFSNYPFLKAQDPRNSLGYLCLNKNLLYRSFESFIYDFLKKACPQKFHQKFGAMLELYIRRILDSAKLDYRDENYLKKHRIANEKIVDFVIEEANCDIFIDSKSVEMSAAGKVAHDFETITRATEKIRKALAQSHSARRILDRLVGRPKKLKSYIIVITFKEMFVGSGSNFSEITNEKDAKDLKENYGPSYIDPSNVFVMTIRDFERLVTNLKDVDGGIGGFLERVRNAELSAERINKKFHFELHLKEAGHYRYPDFLHEKYQEMVDDIVEEFRKSTAQ